MNSTTNTEFLKFIKANILKRIVEGGTTLTFKNIEITGDNVLQQIEALTPLKRTQTPRPQGESKRKFHSTGSTFWLFECPCGKSSGSKTNKKAFNLWIRLHKKRCSVQKIPALSKKKEN